MAKKKKIEDDRVLQKALVVISEKGPEVFTLQDVAKEVGLSPATLLQRFGSKQQLLIKAVQSAVQAQNTTIEFFEKSELPWDEELMGLLSEMPEGFGSREDIAKSLSMLKLDIIDKELHPIARELFESLRARIEKVLLKAKSNAHLREQIDIQSLCWQLDALRHGWIIQWSLSGEGTLVDWIRQSCTQFLKGVRV